MTIIQILETLILDESIWCSEDGIQLRRRMKATKHCNAQSLRTVHLEIWMGSPSRDRADIVLWSAAVVQEQERWCYNNYYWMNRLESILSSEISAKSEVRIARTDRKVKKPTIIPVTRYSAHLDDWHQTKCWSGARVFFFSGEQIVRQESCRPRIDHPGGWRLLKGKMKFTGSPHSCLLQSISRRSNWFGTLGVEPRVLMKIHRCEVDPQPGYDLSCVSFHMYCFMNSCMPERARGVGSTGQSC